jgi:Putative prokaryotic signal transducing protein
MRKVHTSDSLLEIAHLRNLLQIAGVDCVVRNERLSSISGEIPFVECWPELWVCRSGDALRARGIIDLALETPAAGPPWTCPDCGEQIEPQFAECWQCAARHPGAVPTSSP